MPVVAIAGAVSGASALAAGGLTAMQTIGAVGGILGGIGALTNSKELMALGGVAGLAGGIGAFAQGQGWLASGTPNSALSDSAASNTTRFINQPAPGLNPAQDYGTAAGSNSIEMGGGLMDSQPAAEASTVAGAIQQSVAQASPAAQVMGAPAATGQTGGMPLAGGLPKAEPDSSVFGSLKKFSAFLDQNKQLSSMLGSFIGGAFDDEKRAKSEYYQAGADNLKAQMRNANDVPRMAGRLNQRGPLFPSTAPTYRGPRVSGLMNAG
jgi:hypothetical protein